MPEGWVHENTIHFTEQEIGIMDRWQNRHSNSFLMVLALGGSSRQKVFIWMQDFCKQLIDQYPYLRIYLLGGSELEGAHRAIAIGVVPRMCWLEH